LLGLAATLAVACLVGEVGAARAGEAPPAAPETPPAAGAQFEGEAVEVPSPGRIRRAILGGKGQFLLLQIADEGLVRIFDTGTATIAGEVPIRMDSLVAATEDCLIVAHPALRLLECWSLADRKRLKTARTPFPGNVMSIAAGCSSDGPLLIYALDRKPYWALIHCKTLRPVQISSLNNESNLKPMELAKEKDGTVVQLAITGWQTRAAANGKVFGLWSESMDAGMCTLALDSRFSVHFAGIRDIAKYVAPLPDGSGICSSLGLYSPDFRSNSHKGFFAPTPDARFLLSLHLTMARSDREVELSKSVGVMSTERMTRVIELDPLPEMTGRVALGNDELPLEERYTFIPSAKLLVTIPPKENRMFVRRVRWSVPAKAEAVAMPAETHKEPGDDAKTPPAVHDLRTWSDPSGKFRLVARLLEVEGNQVTLQTEDGSKYSVSLDRLSEADAAYARSQESSRKP
jgi:hypothetical protein